MTLLVGSAVVQSFLWGLVALAYVDEKYLAKGFVDGGGVDGSIEAANLGLAASAVVLVLHVVLGVFRCRSAFGPVGHHAKRG